MMTVYFVEFWCFMMITLKNKVHSQNYVFYRKLKRFWKVFSIWGLARLLYYALEVSTLYMSNSESEIKSV